VIEDPSQFPNGPDGFVILFCVYFSRERPRHTAARECAEETFGLLGRQDKLFQMLGDYKANNVFKVQCNSLASRPSSLVCGVREEGLHTSMLYIPGPK
jgi:hypothetical protein